MVVNTCQAGHLNHNTLQVQTRVGPMEVFNWELYKDFAGYCTGQDDVSRTLINQGHWEPVESQIVRDVLMLGDRAMGIIDVGAHIGWYSIMAAKMNYAVMAFEGDAENCAVLKRNAKLNHCADKISIYNWWIDASHPPINPEDKHFVKMDIEGNERYAVAMFAPLLRHGGANYVLMEVSPIFKPGYPRVVAQMQEWGYEAYRLPDKPTALRELLKSHKFDANWDFGQANFLFVGPRV